MVKASQTKAQEFAVGTIVRLKSGGPEMTVKGWSSYQNWQCQWFAGKKLEQGYFETDSLVLVEPEAKGA